MKILALRYLTSRIKDGIGCWITNIVAVKER